MHYAKLENFRVTKLVLAWESSDSHLEVSRYSQNQKICFLNRESNNSYMDWSFKEKRISISCSGTHYIKNLAGYVYVC
jgi:hypothetical protein